MGQVRTVRKLGVTVIRIIVLRTGSKLEIIVAAYAAGLGHLSGGLIRARASEASTGLLAHLVAGPVTLLEAVEALAVGLAGGDLVLGGVHGGARLAGLGLRVALAAAFLSRAVVLPVLALLGELQLGLAHRHVRVGQTLYCFLHRRGDLRLVLAAALSLEHIELFCSGDQFAFEGGLKRLVLVRVLGVRRVVVLNGGVLGDRVLNLFSLMGASVISG